MHADSHIVPLGSANVVRDGKDVTIVAIGQMLHVALRAAGALEGEGIDVEIVDPRSIAP